MAKATVTKSSVIRGIIENNPQAPPKEIQALLKQQGVKASSALVNKIKYGRMKKKGGKGRTGPNKADSIRQAWQDLGRHSRPRDIIAHLATQGVEVSSAQVSTLRGKNGYGARRADHVLSLDNLLAAKQFVAKLGSIEVAREALASLARLLGD